MKVKLLIDFNGLKRGEEVEASYMSPTIIKLGNNGYLHKECLEIISEDGGYMQEEVPQENTTALTKQEGGDHYKTLKIQPVEYIVANNLTFLQGNVVKYITRYKQKNGVEDIKKVIHYCELILQLEYGHKP